MSNEVEKLRQRLTLLASGQQGNGRDKRQRFGIDGTGPVSPTHKWNEVRRSPYAGGHQTILVQTMGVETPRKD